MSHKNAHLILHLRRTKKMFVTGKNTLIRSGCTSVSPVSKFFVSWNFLFLYLFNSEIHTVNANMWMFLQHVCRQVRIEKYKLIIALMRKTCISKTSSLQLSHDNHLVPSWQCLTNETQIFTRCPFFPCNIIINNFLNRKLDRPKTNKRRTSQHA